MATSHGITASSDQRSWVERSFSLMASGQRSDFDQLVHPEATNREAHAEPPATRQPGPEGYYATALWLRGTYADLAFAVHEVVADGDLIVAHVTMSGRQVADAVFHRADGSVHQVFPATGKAFAITQSHWYRMRDGLVIEHWANRDDTAMATQLGWVPPSPLYVLRMRLATRGARRRQATTPSARP